jgi:hypothetical protein
MKDILYRLKRYLNGELHTLKKYSRKKDFYIWLCLTGLLFVVYYANSFHEEFTDEFDNILGGVYILHGKLPYIGFFSHHNPVPYFLASFIAIFSGHSFVAFRILYAIFLFVFAILGYYAVRKSVGNQSSRFYVGFIGVTAIAATYFWGHMLLADSLAAVFFGPALAIIFLKSLYGVSYRIRDICIISILLSLTLLTSMTFSYLVFGTYLFVLIHYFRYLRRTNIQTILFPFIAFGIPYMIFVAYLLITGSLSSFIEQSIVFNQKYYIYNYPRAPGSQSSFINPIRYAIVISYEFFWHFRDLLLQAATFNFTFPLNITLAVANIFVLIYLLYRRKFILFFFVIFALTFSNARSNPLESKETDFQSAVYLIISFFNITFLLTKLWEKLTSSISTNARVIYTILFFFLSLYAFYAGSFLLFGFFTKTYDKYMGTEPLIYDRYQYAKIVNDATPEGESAWIGPIEFKELLYLDRPIPSRYHILIPGMGRSPEITADLMEEYNTDKPAVIWFDKRYSVLGQNPQQYAPFFMDFLKQNYVTLYNEDTQTKTYESLVPRDDKIDVETKLYIRKDKYDEVINRLLEHNLIKKHER